MEEYYATMHARLPDPMYAMPLHEAARIVRARWRNGTCVADGVEADEVRRRLARSDGWASDVTLRLEIVRDDPRRLPTKDALHILEATDDAGRPLERAAIEAIGAALGLPLVRRQPLKSKAKVMQVVRRLDDVDTLAEVRAGIRVVDVAGRVHELRSWQQRRLTETRPLPTRAWFADVVHGAADLSSVHEAVETLEGPLDAACVARRLLVDALARVRDSDATSDALDEVGLLEALRTTTRCDAR